MPDLNADSPAFIPMSAPAPPTQASSSDPDFLPATGVPTQSAHEEPDPPFIPLKDSGEGLTSTIWNGVKNVGYNSVIRPFSAFPQLAQDIYHGNWTGVQGDVRHNLEAGLDPFQKPEDVDTHLQVTPDAGVQTHKGTWAKISSGSGLPLAGQFHRTGAGAIEGEAEDWITGQLNPLNIGLAAVSMGSSVVAGGLEKVGLSAAKALTYTKYAKLTTDIAFLSKFGYSTFSQAIPRLEQDWKDYSNATDPKQKAAISDHLQREGVDIVLGTLAAGLASRGIESDVRDIRLNSPKGKAVANNEYSDAIHEYQAQNQVHSAQAKQVYEQGRAAVPDETRQTALSNNIEAASSLKQLREWEANAPEEEKPGYQAAQQLTDKELSLRDKLKGMLDGWKARLQAQGLLAPDGGRDNYVPHRPSFEDEDENGEPISRTAADGERDFLKQRIYPSHFDGEQAGIQYKTKSLVKLVSDYIERAGNMIARNDLGEGLAKANMNEGTPMAVSGGWAGYPADVPLTPLEIQLYKQKGQFDDLLKRGRIYEVPAGAEADNIRARQAAAAGNTVNDLSANHGMIPRGEFPEGYHDFQDSTTGGSVNVKKGIPREQAIEKINTHRQSVGSNENPSDLAIQKAKNAGERYTELKNGKFIPAPQPIYKLKVSDYRDSGLRINRPLAATEEAQSAIVPHPDMNSFPGEAIIRQGQGGIPRDPRTGAPTARVPVFVHPEVFPHLDDMLNTTAPKNSLLRGALWLSTRAKNSLLSLSPFHWATVTSRMLEANPTFTGMKSIAKNVSNVVSMPTPIDYFNLTADQTKAINDGLVVGNTRPGFSDYTQEGNATTAAGSIINRIPLLGTVNHWLESRLFGPQGYISGMKFDLYQNLKGEIMKSHPTLDETAAGRVAASQVNNKFGGLNYALLGRSSSSQTAARAFLLAPDFLESTGRSVLDLGDKYGTNLVKAFIGFNAMHYMFARAMNYVVNGQLHPESGFKVLSADGKKEYGLRTTLGDFLHFAEAPREFMANRVNPLLIRTPIELLEGVDAQGNKVSKDQMFWDAVRQVTPIPLQGLTPRQQITQPSKIDDVLKSFGWQSTKKFSPAETLAYQLSTEKNQRTPLEGDALAAAQKKFALADALREATKNKDIEAKTKATKDVMAATKGDNPILSYQQASEMLNEAAVSQSRLSSTIKHLDLEDSLSVYDAAGFSEKKEIRNEINQKIESWYKSLEAGKKPTGQYKALQPRIDRFFKEKIN